MAAQDSGTRGQEGFFGIALLIGCLDNSSQWKASMPSDEEKRGDGEAVQCS